MGASLLDLAQASWPQPLAKIDLSQQQELPWLRCGMQLVNLLSSIAAREIFESVSLSPNVYLVFAIQFLLVHRSQ
jgi:hypothetical protein